MKLDELKIILIRLYKEYVKQHLKRIFITLIISPIVPGSTICIARILDPGENKIFFEQNKAFFW